MTILLDYTHIALSIVNSVNSNLQLARQICDLIVSIVIVIKTCINIEQTKINLIVLLILSLNLFRKLLYEICLRNY